MNIRRAEEKDTARVIELLFAVNQLHYEGRPDLFCEGARKYTDEELAAIFQDDGKPVFVAEDESGRVLGYAFCLFQTTDSHVLNPIKTLYVDDLCVDAKFRHQKIGRQLLDYVIDYAKKNGCYNVTLNVWACNESALRFYQSYGMQVQKLGMEMILNEAEDA